MDKTVFGSFDYVEMISAVCEEENIWLHMDGCLGANMLVSENYRHLLKGSHSTDSSSWNPHKSLEYLSNVPYLLLSMRTY